MPRALTLGVLTPFLGGWYFGGLLDGIARAAGDAGANVVAFQTLDAGSDDVEITHPRDPGHRLAWDHIAGFIVVVNAVSPGHIAELRAAGKQVVVISHEFAETAVPVVLPDNGVGIRAAVGHLVEHGHRRIAFVGCLTTGDIHERFVAYQQALRWHGLEPDSELVFATSDNQITGGAEAARAMLDAQLPVTAVVAGTDANAIGLMQTLAATGCRIPEDLAVIGFDDGPSAAFTTPSLSTVKQPVHTIARTAVATLLDAVADGGTRIEVPTELVVRESCGCPTVAPVAIPPSPTTPAYLSSTASSLLRRTSDQAATAVATVVRPVDTRTRPRPTTAVPHAAAPHAAVPDALRLVGDIPQMLMALRQADMPRSNADGEHLQAALNAQYEVSMDLLRGHQEDPRELEWLRRTTAHSAVLGLWTQDHRPAAHDRHLEIAGGYARDGRSTDDPGTAGRTSAAQFPPPELLAGADGTQGRMTFVVPVKVGTSDWGLLAIVDQVETRVATGREPISHWTALLAVALDHQAVLGALRDQEGELRLAALYDHLTGLPNRALFLDRLGKSIERHPRGTDSQLGVFFLDLDDFKVINDSLGHSVGDRLLVEVAHRIRAVLPTGATTARFGGDEFMILLDDMADERAAAEVADRLQAVLREPFQVAGQSVVLTASIGVALDGGRYGNALDLLRDADLAMYSAKSNDKGSHSVFDVAMHAKAVERLRVETELREALERGEFEVHYQPITELKTGQTYGFEALVRWRHPEHGMLAPDRFLPVAEQTGIILPLSSWILAESCRQLASWKAAGGAPALSISVNVSNRQFWQSPLVDEVAQVLRDTGVEPHCLALEITEGVIMRDVDRACEVLEGLHQLGCRVHIDDFGTGYSSLEALHRLPIDALKIDRSFVSRLGVNQRSGEFVRTIVLMGQNLGIELIAEGIETSEHQNMLVESACPLGQGYLFSRPVPAGQAEAFALGTNEPSVPPAAHHPTA